MRFSDGYVWGKPVYIRRNITIVFLTAMVGAAAGCGASTSSSSQSKSSAGEKNAITQSEISPEDIADNGKKMPEFGDCLSDNDGPFCQVEKLIHKYTNDFRKKEGKEVFGFAPRIGCVARMWSDEMMAREKISHEWMQQHITTEKFYDECDGSGRLNAENVSMGTYGDKTKMSEKTIDAAARDFVDRWISSPGHRSNLLGNYLNMGVGLSVGPDGAWYATQIMGSGN